MRDLRLLPCYCGVALFVLSSTSSADFSLGQEPSSDGYRGWPSISNVAPNNDEFIGKPRDSSGTGSESNFKNPQFKYEKTEKERPTLVGTLSKVLRERLQSLGNTKTELVPLAHHPRFSHLSSKPNGVRPIPKADAPEYNPLRLQNRPHLGSGHRPEEYDPSGTPNSGPDNRGGVRPFVRSFHLPPRSSDGSGSQLRGYGSRGPPPQHFHGGPRPEYPEGPHRLESGSGDRGSRYGNDEEPYPGRSFPRPQQQPFLHTRHPHQRPEYPPQQRPHGFPHPGRISVPSNRYPHPETPPTGFQGPAPLPGREFQPSPHPDPHDSGPGRPHGPPPPYNEQERSPEDENPEIERFQSNPPSRFEGRFGIGVGGGLRNVEERLTPDNGGTFDGRPPRIHPHRQFGPSPDGPKDNYAPQPIGRAPPHSHHHNRGPPPRLGPLRPAPNLPYPPFLQKPAQRPYPGLGSRAGEHGQDRHHVPHTRTREYPAGLGRESEHRSGFGPTPVHPNGEPEEGRGGHGKSAGRGKEGHPPHGKFKQEGPSKGGKQPTPHPPHSAQNHFHPDLGYPYYVDGDTYFFRIPNRDLKRFLGQRFPNKQT